MAKTNQIITNKTFGDKATFLITAEDSKGELLQAEFWVKPGGEGPPEHFHPVQSETFRVVKGTLNLLHDGKPITLKAGDRYTIPPNSAHKFWNGNTAEAIFTVELRPALKTEFFLESIYSLDVQGKVNKQGLPGPLQFAAILNECYGELFVVGPPILAQKFMAKVVGRLAKAIGFKGYVPFPG